MTLNQIASKIAKLEEKKSQASIGDIREILKIILDDYKFSLKYIKDYDIEESIIFQLKALAVKKKAKIK